MPERISELLHDEATALDVPHAPVGDVLARGRGLRRQRRAVTALASLAGAAALGGSALVVLEVAGPSPRDSSVATGPAPTAAYGVVLASGSRVAVGEGRATVPGTVHDLVFTSEGALVRSNENGGNSDGSGDEALTLVRPDGSTVDLGIVPEGVGPATDPSEPLYALAEKDDSGFVAVLRDVRTGDEVDRVPLPAQPPSYWEVPPLAIDGRQVFVGYESAVWSVDRRTGDARRVPRSQGGIPMIAGGRMVVGDGRSVTVVDVARGTELMTRQVPGYGYGELSPDGKHLIVMVEDGVEPGESNATLYSVDTGASLVLPWQDSGWGWSWTPRGEALGIGERTLTVCDVAGGCREQALPDGFADTVRPGGQRFES